MVRRRGHSLAIAVVALCVLAVSIAARGVADAQTSGAAAVHPRLILDPEGFERLRTRTHPKAVAMRDDLIKHADLLIRTGTPAWRPPGPNDEQLWQRPVGNAMPTIALAYKLTGDPRYLSAAMQFANASISYPTWAAGKNRNSSLAASHQLAGLAFVYDWLYHDMTEPTRRGIRNVMLARGQELYASLQATVSPDQPMLANWAWVPVSALGTAAAALLPEAPQTAEWANFAIRYFRRGLPSMGADGAGYEGLGYWAYALEYVLKFASVATTALGENFYENDWLRNAASFRLYLALPRESWSQNGSLVDLADSPRTNWYGPDYLLRGLASRYRDSHAQWLAEQIERTGLGSSESKWLGLTWYDPSLPPGSPVALPTLRHFQDQGIVSARSDWSGHESLVVFKSGPFAGHQVAEVLGYDPGATHAHPDANHFVVFGDGEWLIRDDGAGAKATGQHNTLLVSGLGQIGEGGKGFDAHEALTRRASARIVDVSSSPAMDVMVGDAAGAYPSDLGLERARRTLLFVKPDVLIVIDDIKTSQVRTLELRFHPEHAVSEVPGGALVASAGKTSLRLQALTQAGVALSAALVPALDSRQGANGKLHRVSLRRNADTWRNAVALSWGRTPPVVTLAKTLDVWRFTIDDRIVEYRWDTGETCTYVQGGASTCGMAPAPPRLLTP